MLLYFRCYVETGEEYTQKGEVNNRLFGIMREISPIMHAHKVKASTLLQIGSKDLRVPPHQGTDYYLRLKANGVNTKLVCIIKNFLQFKIPY